MIIETNANQLYQVRETGDINLSHVFYGIEVKRSGKGFVPKAKAKEMLVSKAHILRIVAN